MADRNDYRIVYPLVARPLLELADATWFVMDCSERGLRVDLERPAQSLDDTIVQRVTQLLPEVEPPGLDARVKGRLILAHGATAQIDGTCVRCGVDDFAIRLDLGRLIPVKLIFEEQRYLRQRFPGWR
jgi:hypothetical protein